MRKDVEVLAQAYSAMLAADGSTPAGVGWPNAPDLASRFEALLGSVDFSAHRNGNRIRLLDLGCGPGLLLDYLSANTLLDCIEYCGVDVLPAAIETARARWPAHRFEFRDIRDDRLADGSFDYAVACGAFTYRQGISHADMENLVRETLIALWPGVTTGISFNVMSKHVDWEREDLFHWPLDDAMAFCKANLSRHVAIRLDYGLWEASICVRKHPVPLRASIPDRWLTQAAEPANPLTSDPLARTTYAAVLARQEIDVSLALRDIDATLSQAQTRELSASAVTRLRTTRAIRRSGLFDDEFYKARYPDIAESGMDPLDHYVRHGDAEGRNPNPVFSPGHYRKNAMAAVSGEASALLHYIEEGERAGADCDRFFNPAAYLAANPPLADFVDRPLFHYLRIGRPANLAVRKPQRVAAERGRRPTRIGAHIGVKDEVELIDRTIAHLRAVGVDIILVCDMESTDGTAEKLERYRADDFVILQLGDQSFDDKIWYERNLEFAKAADADWVVFLDADEYLIPATGNIKDCAWLEEADALSIDRYNIALGPGGPWMPEAITPARYDEMLLIARGIPNFRRYLRGNPETPYLLGEIEPKIMVRPERISALGDGLHDVLEVDDAALSWAKPPDLLIAHLPLTTWARFDRKVEDYRLHLTSYTEETEYTLSGDGMWEAPCWQWRRWIKLKDEGRLDEELERNTFDDQRIAELRSNGTVRSAAELFERRRPYCPARKR